MLNHCPLCCVLLVVQRVLTDSSIASDNSSVLWEAFKTQFCRGSVAVELELAALELCAISLLELLGIVVLELCPMLLNMVLLLITASED